MKKVFSFIFVVSVLLCLLTGCSKNDDSNSKSQYYVKYEVDVIGSYSYAVITNITVNTEKGKQSFKTGNAFSESFGPVEKDFKAKIIAYVDKERNYNVNARIYVCRDKEPFVLKETQTAIDPKQGNPVVAEYIIDF